MERINAEGGPRRSLPLLADREAVSVQRASARRPPAERHDDGQLCNRER